MKTLFVLLAFTITFKSFALTPPFLVEADGVSATSIENLTAQIEKGSIVLLGELHDNLNHHNNQLAVIEALISQGHNVHLGMEFLNYTDQYEIYKYGAGITSQEEFMKAIDWTNLETFSFYSPMLDAVNNNGGSVVGLNVPRPITSTVAKNGVESLKTSELALLPTPLEKGNDFYLERFRQAIGGGHVPEDLVENYFWSQSIWDDVMSWRALEFMKRDPQGTLVIIVGDFHAAYGGGLPEVLNRKGFSKVKVLSQTIKSDRTDQELFDAITPHPDYGPRGDWIWVTE